MTKKTHTEVKTPKVSIRYLADYMAASERAKRAIVQSCKYRPHARIIQHDEAKATISNFLRGGSKNPSVLKEKAAFIRNKLADDDFEASLNDHNADYLERFAAVYQLFDVELPDAEVLPGKKLPPLPVEGVLVTFVPDLILQRTTKTNKIKTGALMLRYAKGKALAKEVADYQSAAIHGYLRAVAEATATDVELGLCLTLDAFSSNVYSAPGNSVSRFSNMRAACASIAERWPAVKPPKGAIF